MKLSTLALVLLFSLSVFISARSDTENGYVKLNADFRESNSFAQNPDRGFFDQIRIDNSLKIPSIIAPHKNIRIYFVLDQFLERPFSVQELNELEQSLLEVAAARRRVTVRFFYDYPPQDVVDSGLKSRRARTATPSMMSVHIQQLGSVLKRRTEAVFAVETGLIGFWGEQHGDTPDKQSPSGIASIVDQWRLALDGTNIQVLVRYPQALRRHVRLNPKLLVEQPRLGYWNDCLGASDDANMSSNEVKVVVGEICTLPPRFDYSCATMLGYFKAIQLDILHANYYRPTIDGWEKGGCLDEIRRRLGYRYIVREARLATDGSWLEIRIDNIGWGKSHFPRPLFLVANGRRIQIIADLIDFVPGSDNLIRVQLKEMLNPSLTLSLETDDGVQFANNSGNLLHTPVSVAP